MFNFSFPSGNTKVTWVVLCFFMRIVCREIMLSDLQVSMCLSRALHLKRIQWETLVRVAIIVTLENLKKFLIIFFFLSSLWYFVPIQYTSKVVILWNLLGHSCVMDGQINTPQLFLSPFVFFWSESITYPHVCNLSFPTSFIGL